MLAIVDESTGVPVRPVTDEDLAGTPTVGGRSIENRSKAGLQECNEEEPTRVKTIQEMVEEARKGDGPVCDNCGIHGEAPTRTNGRRLGRAGCRAGGTMRGAYFCFYRITGSASNHSWLHVLAAQHTGPPSRSCG